MKKLLALLVCLGLIGCISVTRMEEVEFQIVSQQRSPQVRVYDYSYNDVYNAIINTLEKRLYFGVSRNHTTKDTIFSTHLVGSGNYFLRGDYMYLFKLESIDQAHTQVTLKAKGGLTTISNKDILDRYIPEELMYSKKE